MLCNYKQVINFSDFYWVSETRCRVWLFATPWAIESMGFPRQEYRSGLPFPFSGGIFPTQGSNPDLPHCKQVLYQLSYQGSPRDILYLHKFLYTHFKTLQYSIWYTGFPGISVVKSHMPMQETQVQSLGTEGPLEKEMITHSSILPWEILWTEEPGGLQTVGSQELDMS